MRLSNASRVFFALVAGALVVNLVLLALVSLGQDQTAHAIDRRDRSLQAVRRVQAENDLLSALVQSYTTTSRTQHLDVYHEILAVREGQRAPPLVADPLSHWRAVAAGRADEVARADGAQARLIDRFQDLDFSPHELQLTQQLLAAAQTLQRIEQVAFAATQGLYDPAGNRFVSDGLPRRDFAIASVHDDRYEGARAGLAQAQSALLEAVHERTRAEVDAAQDRLRRAMWTALVVNLALVPLLLGALLALRRRVLLPIQRLEAMAGRITEGRYQARSQVGMAAMAELQTLAATMDTMASAVDTEMQRRQRQQLEVEQARRAAEAAAQAKASFLATMSHEIRTPMNAIMGMTQLALDSAVDDRQRDQLRKSLQASEHLLGVVNDVLDFSKIEAGAMALECAPLRLEDVVGRALLLVRQAAQAKELELLCDFADPLLLAQRGHLLGDALRLQQVLVNLLGNAVKFTAAGQVRLTLDTAAPEGAEPGVVPLLLRVSDTGIGIDAAQMKQLFGEFSQADGSITRRFGGSGLGLAITRRLVQLMGGRIEVDSRPGSGSSFTVHLSLQADRQALPAPAVPAIGPWRVLVVDDQRDTRLAVQSLLQRLGVGSVGGCVRVAADEEQARRALDEGVFDLVLLDWVLPSGDATGLLRHLRGRWPGTRVVVMSAYDSQDIRQRAQALGVAETLAKPVLPDDLRALWHGLLPAAAPAEPGPDPAALEGLRVLLVEDNALNRQLATELLQARGVRVASAVNGLEAVERLRAAGPDAFHVVLMDLQMPVMDGYTAMRQLRAMPGFHALPVLAMTAAAMADERERCLAAGMQGHIAKPVRASTLFSALVPYRPPRLAPVAGTALPAQPTPLPVPQLPAVPGVDMATLLASCDGQVALARRLLQGFAQDHARGLSGWPALAAQDTAALGRAAHSLRGAAASLGLADVAQAAGTIEAACQRAPGGLDPAALGRQVDSLDQLLARRLDGIELALAGGSGRPAPPRERPQEAPAESTVDLQQLQQLLRDSDSHALQWWREHEAQVVRQLSAVRARRLRQAMRSLDFDAALEALVEPGLTEFGETL